VSQIIREIALNPRIFIFRIYCVLCCNSYCQQLWSYDFWLCTNNAITV